MWLSPDALNLWNLVSLSRKSTDFLRQTYWDLSRLRPAESCRCLWHALVIGRAWALPRFHCALRQLHKIKSRILGRSLWVPCCPGHCPRLLLDFGASAAAVLAYAQWLWKGCSGIWWSSDCEHLWTITDITAFFHSVLPCPKTGAALTSSSAARSESMRKLQNAD